jgi:hypothetical protein
MTDPSNIREQRDDGPNELDYQPAQLIRLPRLIPAIGWWCVIVGALVTVDVLLQFGYLWQTWGTSSAVPLTMRPRNILGIALECAKSAAGVWLIIGGCGAIYRRREQARSLRWSLAFVVALQLIMVIDQLLVGMAYRGIANLPAGYVMFAMSLIRMFSPLVPTLILLTIITRREVKAAMDVA